jgi:hypothetical protein
MTQITPLCHNSDFYLTLTTFFASQSITEMNKQITVILLPYFNSLLCHNAVNFNEVDARLCLTHVRASLLTTA